MPPGPASLGPVVPGEAAARLSPPCPHRRRSAQATQERAKGRYGVVSCQTKGLLGDSGAIWTEISRDAGIRTALERSNIEPAYREVQRRVLEEVLAKAKLAPADVLAVSQAGCQPQAGWFLDGDQSDAGGGR